MTETKYPSAVYAAAGVGDFVYEQLRKLQEKATAFGADAETKAPEWKKKVADLSAKVDADKVRESVVTGAQFAAEKATQVYSTLVTRGEKAFTPSAPPSTAAASTGRQASSERQASAEQPSAGSQATVNGSATVAKKAAPRKKAAPGA